MTTVFQKNRKNLAVPAGRPSSYNKNLFTMKKIYNLFVLIFSILVWNTNLVAQELASAGTATHSNAASGNSGADLQLTALTTNRNPAQWAFFEIKFIVKNNGTAPATGVKVKLNAPAGIVYKGGDEYAATAGIFNHWSTHEWTVGDLPVGRSQTLTVRYFNVTATAKTVFGQISAQNEPDADSQPNNNTGIVPAQDDEVAVSINGSGSCAFTRIVPASATSPAPSDDNVVLTEQSGGYQFELNNGTNATTYHFDNTGAVLSTNQTVVAGLRYEVRLSPVSNSDVVQMIFNTSPDVPAGTVVDIDLNYSGTATAVLLDSRPFKISRGYAFGVGIVDVNLNPNIKNFIVTTDNRGQNARVFALPNPAFYGGFSTLTEGPDGALFTEWRTSGNFSMYALTPSGNVWRAPVTTDTPSITWVTTKASPDGQYVYIATFGSFSSSVAKYEAATGVLIDTKTNWPSVCNNSATLCQPRLRDIEPTADGGVLFSSDFYDFFSPSDRKFVIGKYDVSGNTLWHLSFTDDYMLYPAGETNDGGAFFAGSNGGSTPNAVFIKTTASGTLSPLCTKGPDLELTLTASLQNPGQWKNTTLTLTLKNNGTVAASNVSVDFINQSDQNVWSKLAYVSHTATAGTSYNAWNGQWSVGTVAPGQSVVLAYDAFTKIAGAMPVFAQVQSQTPNDADSSPANNVTGIAAEDDEAQISINKTNQLLPADARLAVPTEMLVIPELEIFPNPAGDAVNIHFGKTTPAKTQIAVLNSLGTEIYRKSIQNPVETQTLDLSNISNGQYFLKIEMPGQQVVVKKLLVVARD